MKQLTYNERVQAIARKTSIRNYGKWGPGLPTWGQSMEDARIAVAESIPDISAAWREGNPDGCIEYLLEQYLKKEGLIPDDGQEVSSNE